MAEYIKREDALQAQNKSMNLGECRKRLERVPAADVRPVVHARWVDVRQEGVCAWTAECSNCRTRNDIPPVKLAHYCPNCGAMMVEDEEGNDGT